MKKIDLVINTFITCIAVMVLGTGCSDPTNENVVEFSSFQKEYQLHSEVVEWLEIWSCTDLRIYDSVLVAIDWKREKIFQVYNINSKRLIGAFGTYGKGPQEFFHCPKLTPVFYFEGKDLIIQLWDWGRSTILNINLSKSIQESRLVENSKCVLPDDFMTSKPFMTDDLRIFGVDQRGVLEMLDPVSREITKFNEPIQINQKLPTPNFEEIARMMFLELAPHIDRIVGSFNVMKRLHIYNKKGELLNVIKEKGKHVLDISDNQFYAKNKVYFSKTFLSDKYILVLNEDRRLGTSTSGELLLFDYEGKALNKYKLDCWISSGSMDWESNKLYTFNYEEGTMITYQLTGIGN